MDHITPEMIEVVKMHPKTIKYEICLFILEYSCEDIKNAAPDYLVGEVQNALIRGREICREHCDEKNHLSGKCEYCKLYFDAVAKLASEASMRNNLMLGFISQFVLREN